MAEKQGGSGVDNAPEFIKSRGEKAAENESLTAAANAGNVAPRGHRFLSRGACSCGWTAGALPSYDQALAAWELHRAEFCPECGEPWTLHGSNNPHPTGCPPAAISLPPVEVGPLPHLEAALREIPSHAIPAQGANAAHQSRYYRPAHLQEFNPPPSTMLEMIGFAATGKCMACGWPLKNSPDEGCVQGNCSFRPGEHSSEYARWWARTQVLTLARRVPDLPVAAEAPLSHEPTVAEEKPLDSNRADVEDAAHGEYR